MLRFPILGGPAALRCYVFQYFWRSRNLFVSKLPATNAQMLRFPILGGSAVLRCYVFQYFWRSRRWVDGRFPATSVQMLCFPILGGSAASCVKGGWCNVPMSVTLSWMRRARPAGQVVGVCAACRSARTEELPPLISRRLCSWHSIFGSSGALRCYVFRYLWRSRRWFVGRPPATSVQMQLSPILGGSATFGCQRRLMQCPHVGDVVLDALGAPSDASGWGVCGMPQGKNRRVPPLDLEGVAFMATHDLA